MKPHWRRQALLTMPGCVLAVIFLCAVAEACNVPVFRYALERWPAEPYELVVIHRGPLASEDQARFDKWQKYAADAACPTNFTLERVDLAKIKDQSMLSQFQAQENPQLPWLMVRYPESAGLESKVWAGPFTSAPLENILDSPARREIARRIVQGESAVWVFLESGVQEQDDRAAQLLAKHLAQLEKTLILTPLTDSPKDKLLNPNGPKLRVAFSVLRVSRSDPAEAFFVRMLLHLDSEITHRQEPMVFPVFGRGIALDPMVGKGISGENIAESAGFVVGACKCEVKRQNPGKALLMTADWQGGAEPPVLFENKPSAPAPEPAALNSALLRNLVLAIVGGLFIVGVISFYRRPRGSASRESTRS